MQTLYLNFLPMKIKILLLSVVLGLGQLVHAQTKQETELKYYEPAPFTVKVGFQNEFESSDQKTADGNRMVVTYEKGSKYNFSLTNIYPLNKNEDLNKDVEARFLKIIAYQADFYNKETGNSIKLTSQTLGGLTGYTTSFDIGEQTYQYRVVVLNNVYYLLSASYPTAKQGDKAVAAFFNSFAKVTEPVPVDDNE